MGALHRRTLVGRSLSLPDAYNENNQTGMSLEEQRLTAEARKESAELTRLLQKQKPSFYTEQPLGNISKKGGNAMSKNQREPSEKFPHAATLPDAYAKFLEGKSRSWTDKEQPGSTTPAQIAEEANTASKPSR